MDAANAAAAAMLRAGGAASAGADAAAPPAPSDVERIAASLGFDVCSDSDDDDELMSLVPADAAAHAEWVDEDEQFDGAPRTEHEALAPPPAPALADLAVAPGRAARRRRRTCSASRTGFLGAVAEIFGPVREPFTPSASATPPATPPRGTRGPRRLRARGPRRLRAPEELSSRGCDASNVYDEELPDHQQGFSDDEDAQAAKALAKKRGRDGAGAPPVYEGPPPPP
ncbi:hypothetical protein JL720_3890 [Aureococcus anophagefferens]|nr:hypothetical protein JL720_3890 [Aureococcus anophagefferens]